MATVETRYPHIVLNDDRQSSIAGTTMKVVELVTAQQAYGWSPESLDSPAALASPTLTAPAAPAADHHPEATVQEPPANSGRPRPGRERSTGQSDRAPAPGRASRAPA